MIQSTKKRGMTRSRSVFALHLSIMRILGNLRSLLLHTGLEEKRNVNVRDRTRAEGNQTNDEHSHETKLLRGVTSDRYSPMSLKYRPDVFL